MGLLPRLPRVGHRHVGVHEVEVRAGGRGAALALVAGGVLAGSVGLLGRRRQAEEAELADLHSGPELDGQRRDVRQLERDVAGEPGVDEAGGGVREEAETAERALALEARGDVVGQRDQLERGSEHELARVQDERLPRLRLDEARELGLVLGGVDVGVLVVVEQPEEAVDAHVDARGLQHPGVVRIEGHSSGVELGGDVTVGEEHGRSLPALGGARPDSC